MKPDRGPPSAPLIVVVLIPVFALMGAAALVGPERLGFVMGSSMFAIKGLVLVLALAKFFALGGGEARRQEPVASPSHLSTRLRRGLEFSEL